MSKVKRGELYWGGNCYEIPLNRRNLNAKSAWDYDPDRPPYYGWSYIHIQTALYKDPRRENPHKVSDLGSCHYETVYEEKYRVKTSKDWSMFWTFIFTGEKPSW